MKIKIEYELELSDEEVEILRHFWKAPIKEDDVQYLMRTEGYKWITRHIDECRAQLEMEVVGGLTQ